MNGEQIFYITLAGIVATVVVAASPIVGAFWQANRAADRTAALKHAMIERGYTADDICRVVAAGEDDEADIPPPRIPASVP